ncbi:MAG: cation:proton antiporter [Euryarchaeota archaeon]|nr:cation:proton antiporter [Euryarchaeota archaeon]
MVELDSATLFIIAGVAIIVGYLANLLFRRFKAPDILIIMLFGWLIGPSALGIITSEMSDLVDTLIPFVSSLALAFIMFTGGLELDIPEIRKAGRVAGALSVLGLVLIISALMVFFIVVLDVPVAMALLAGVVFGSTSAPTVIPLIMRMSCSTRIKTVLTLESAITDVAVVGLGTAIVIVLGSPAVGLSGALATLAISIIIAVALGVVMGVVWLYSTSVLRQYRYYYILTLAVILLIFAICEIVAPAGGGVIAVLVFGLVLSNAHNLPVLPHLDLKKVGIDENFLILNEETSFFIKVFFFTFLGLFVSMLTFTSELLFYGCIVLLVIFLIRQVVVSVFKRLNHWERSELIALRLMFPRGLCTVIVAILPFTMGVSEGITKETLLGIVAMVVIGTTMLTSIGAWAVESQLKKEGKTEIARDLCPEEIGLEL